MSIVRDNRNKLLARRYDYKSLKRTEWSAKFEELMRNRLIVGAYRYGKLGEKNKILYDRLKSIKRRLELYESDGNDEHLVDIANLCLCEFVDGNHPNKHFASADDAEHVKEKETQ